MLPDGDPNKLTIEDIRDKLNNRFERMDERESQIKQEMAFANFAKQLKGTCYNCGQYGHKGAECPNKRTNNGKGKGKLICFYCGEEGHVAEKCEVKKKAELARTKRNKANQGTKEVAAWAVDTKEEEEDNLEDYLSDDQSYYGCGL